MSRHGGTGLVLILGFTLLAAAAAQAWQDGQFDEEDWELVPWVSPLDSGDSGASVALTIAHAGNPGAHRAMGVSVGPGPDDGAMAVQFYQWATWDPGTSGPVLAIDASLDFSTTDSSPTRVGVVLEQGGVFYMHVLAAGADHLEWISYVADDLTVADFAPLDPALTAPPDFSTSGAPLRFGFATGQFAAEAEGHQSFYHGVDNWRLVVDAGPVSATTVAPLAAAPLAHPNPFNPMTEITFELPDEGFATLRIHDLSGRLVRTLEARHFTAGRHSVVWRGENEGGRAVASGVYLAVLETTRGQVSRRLTLVR